MRYLRFYFLQFAVCAILFLLPSCLEKISLDHIAQKRLVMEAKVLSGEKAWIKISETVSKTASNDFPFVENAQVKLMDDQGRTETLTYVGEGIYQSDSIQGVLGRQYFLEVAVDDLLVTGSSKMKATSIPVDSIWYEEQNDSENQFQRTHITTRVITPPGDPVHGLLKVFINEELVESGFFIKNAAEVNDIDFSIRRILGLDEEIKAVLYLLEPQVYDYLETIYDRANTSLLTIAPVAPPDNPTPNLEGEVLGYFSAMAVSQKILVVE